jgi:hypothetical protein
MGPCPQLVGGACPARVPSQRASAPCDGIGHAKSRRKKLARGDGSPLGAVSLPLNRNGKVVADFCSDQGAMKEHSPSYATEKQR